MPGEGMSHRTKRSQMARADECCGREGHTSPREKHRHCEQQAQRPCGRKEPGEEAPVNKQREQRRT